MAIDRTQPVTGKTVTAAAQAAVQKAAMARQAAREAAAALRNPPKPATGPTGAAPGKSGQ